MASPDRERRGEIPSYIVPVVLRGDLSGHQITQHDKALDTRSMFNKGIPEIKADATVDYSSAYFRTRGGWIYHLSHIEADRGQLIGPSRETGRVVTQTFRDWYISVRRGLVVGLLFVFDGDGTKYTPVVTEIVGVVDKPPVTKGIRRLFHGRYNNIIEDFEAQGP